MKRQVKGKEKGAHRTEKSIQGHRRMPKDAEVSWAIYTRPLDMKGVQYGKSGVSEKRKKSKNKFVAMVAGPAEQD